ncbi:MAG: glycosyl hydrolase [Treponema sp.]
MHNKFYKQVIIFFLVISSIELAFARSNQLKFEAEKGDFYSVKDGTELKGYSGEGYVEFPSYEQGILQMNLDIQTSGEYCMFLHILNLPREQNPDMDIVLPEKIKRFQLEQGENIVASQKLPVEKKFTDVMVNCVLNLDQGSNEFYFVGLEGEWQLDYITLKPATEKLKQMALPSKNLCNKNATDNAKKVYEYLCDMQGKGILSGQQMYSRQPEMEAINNLTGKYPAILGIDLIDYSPSRVKRGTRGTTENDAIKWWKNGGLVTCCWHWNAPLGLVDKKEKNKEWFSGFRPEATTFDFATALNNPESEDYKALINDIDAIAKPLLKMQKEGVVLLWRPLHEASGGWFWWGAHESEPYIKLYRLLYERLTNYHKINNLIWVWNGQNASWYPGDDVVDIISNDIYPGAKEYTASEQKLSDVRSSSEKPKLVAMSENGTLPDIDLIAQNKVPWSWYCTWNGDFTSDAREKYSEKFTEAEVLKKYYQNPFLITLDELPSFTDEK